jgi:hypothetical protein
MAALLYEVTRPVVVPPLAIYAAMDVSVYDEDDVAEYDPLLLVVP